MTLLLIAILLGAPPPISEVVDADAMAWVHAPRVGASLSALGRTGFAEIAAVLLPDDVRKALAAAPDAEMMVASYRSAEPGEAEVVLWLDAAQAEAASVAMMERWLGQLGFKAGDKREAAGVALHTLTGANGTMTVFSGDGRCGWSSDGKRAEAMLTRAEKSLSGDAGFQKLLARSADADVRGRIDVQRFYGMLARTPQGPQLAGQIRRLGLDTLEAVEMQARLRGKKRLLSELRLLLPKPWKDLPAALGPAMAHERPAMIPKAASGFARLSVKPADLWYVAEKLYGYERAMESSLVRAQLDSVERRLGKSFTEDALGHAPRVWTTWSTNEGRVLVAEVADGKLAATLLVAYAEVLPTFFPDLSVTKHAVGKQQLLVLSVRGRTLVALGFSDRAVVVASSRAQAEGAMAARRGKSSVLGATRVVAHGQGTFLLAPLARLLPSTARQRLGDSQGSWQLRAVDDGFIVDTVASAR